MLRKRCVFIRIRKGNSVDVKLHDLTKVKLKTAGNTSVVQFAARNNKTGTVRNLSKDTYLDVKTGEERRKNPIVGISLQRVCEKVLIV